uniref:Uncharacterized protein n=1 Tax=Helianthus annuus TaxID=4232 RepID=A0A251T1E5_HELAN
MSHQSSRWMICERKCRGGDGLKLAPLSERESAVVDNQSRKLASFWFLERKGRDEMAADQSKLRLALVRLLSC